MAPKYEDEKGEIFGEWNWLNNQQMVQFECPRHWNLSVTSNSWVGCIPLTHYWPFWVIRNGSSVWRWKRLINIRTKWAEWAANKLVWMPQALDYINFFLTIGLVVCSGQTIFRLEIRHFSQAHWTQRSYMFSRNLQKNSSRISSILKVARNYYDHCVKWASLFDSVK